MPLDPRTLVTAASAMARLAGAELWRRFSQARTVGFKPAAGQATSIDLVTDADTAAERLIVEAIRRDFPGHGILAEESGRAEGDGRHRWIIDPLDGTTNYAHRMPHFSVSIAVEDELGACAGVVYDPGRDELFAAGRGLGATLDGEPLHVTAEASLGGSLLATGFPYDVWDHPELPVRMLEAFLRRSQGIRRAGSAALDMCYVAAGRYDGYFEGQVKPWDVAAGALILSEAGGRVTHLDGTPFSFARPDVLATNAALHEEMVVVARQSLAELGRLAPAPKAIG
jgi:myo-inositol-1(or 4)-monophosphatase